MLAHLHHRIAEPFAGGMETHTALVADELVRRGHDVTLFAKAGSLSRARVEAILEADFDYLRVRREDGADACDRALDSAVRRALAGIDQGGFDLVFNNSLSPLPYTQLGDRPVLTVLHTPPTLPKVNAVIGQPHWRPGPRHTFVAVSQVNAASWSRVLPRVESVPNGIRVERWPVNRRPEPGLAVWSARITPEKGLHLAIAAARAAGMRLEFSGPVADEDYYRHAVEPLLGPDVVYRGHLDHVQLARHLGRGEVFVSSSIWAEPFGLALVEAMACGTPVAALPSGAAGEVVGAHGGVIAAQAGVAALAEAIRAARGQDRGLVRAHAQTFGAGSMIDRYEQLMDTLLCPPVHQLPVVLSGVFARPAERVVAAGLVRVPLASAFSPGPAPRTGTRFPRSGPEVREPAPIGRTTARPVRRTLAEPG